MPAIDTEWAPIAAAFHVRYLSPYGLLCPKGACLEMTRSVPVAFDRNHFTAEGSEAVARLMPARLLSR